MKILFVNLSALVFDVATPDREPLGGSESCVCYLARQLAANGHNVTLAARLPPDTPEHVMGVRHKPHAIIQEKDFFAAEKFDAIIACNAPIAMPHLREISPASFTILWLHMLPDQPAVQSLPQALRVIDCIMYVAHGQKEAYGLTHPAQVIGNGMAPAFENMFAAPRELLAAKQNRAAYTSTPFRGLPLLIQAMAGLQTGTELDIYSSMRVYQKSEDEHAATYELARKNPLIHYHGAVPQPELARRLRAAAFLAYPCTFAECYCIAALEAQAAGMKVVTTDFGSLKESTMGYADLMPIKQGGTREEFAAAFRSLLEKNIAEFKTNPAIWAEKQFAQVQHVNRACTWALRAREWEQFLLAARRLDRAS